MASRVRRPPGELPDGAYEQIRRLRRPVAPVAGEADAQPVEARAPQADRRAEAPRDSAGAQGERTDVAARPDDLAPALDEHGGLVRAHRADDDRAAAGRDARQR